MPDTQPDNGPWTFVRHSNGTTTWEAGTNGAYPPYNVSVQVSPHHLLVEALDAMEGFRGSANYDASARAKLFARFDRIRKQIGGE